MGGPIRTSFVAALMLVGCRHDAGVTRLASAPPKPAGCQLQLFATEVEVKRPFEAVCLVDTGYSSTVRRPTDAAEVPEAARRQACECGGDAMITAADGTAVVKVIRFTGP
ncbi:MAG TPA: hypothetical protein VMT45_10160 [Thermoanaerobaculaceae bacterium]|nr:hypothetical protein [Thermoanaerobaculaceae bacterium]